MHTNLGPHSETLSTIVSWGVRSYNLQSALILNAAPYCHHRNKEVSLQKQSIYYMKNNAISPTLLELNCDDSLWQLSLLRALNPPSVSLSIVKTYTYL